MFLRRGTALAVLAWLALGAPLQAQDAACSLESNEHTDRAVGLIQGAQERTDLAERARLYGESLQALRAAFQQRARDPAALYLAGHAHIGLGQYEAADSMFSRLLEAVPGCRSLAEQARQAAWVDLYNRGIRAYSEGDEDGALEAFEKANVIFKDARSLDNAGLLYVHRGDTATAMERLREALAVARDDAQRRSAVATLAEALKAMGQTREMLQLYGEQARAHPADVALRGDYAVALAEAGRVDSAKAILTDLLGREDLTLDEWNQVGVGFFRIGSYKEAVKALSRAREIEPYHNEAMINLGDALLEAGEYRAARALADTLVQWYPYDAFNYNVLTTALSKTGQPAEALKTIQRRESLPFEFRLVQLSERGEGRYVLQGEVLARDAGAGQDVVVPFEFLGKGGAVVAARELGIRVPASGRVSGFAMELQATEPIVGFRYGEARRGS